MLGIDEQVGRYVQCRDLIRAMEARHKEELKDLKEALNLLSGHLESFLDQSGKDVNSVNTKQGTFYRSTKYKASLSDPEIFMDFVRTTQKFELLNRAANVTAVVDYVKKNEEMPPGCKLSARTTIGVTRPGAKKDDSDD